MRPDANANTLDSPRGWSMRSCPMLASLVNRHATAVALCVAFLAALTAFGSAPDRAHARSARVAHVTRQTAPSSSVAWNADLRRAAQRALGRTRWTRDPFSSSSVWNAPVTRHAAIARQSGRMVANLASQVRDANPWINTWQYSVPVYVVRGSQARQRVLLDTHAPALQSALSSVPVPAHARAALGSDEHMTIWQPSTDTLWDFWHMHKVGGAWHASWGGEMTHVSANPGYFVNAGSAVNWGATATGLPLLGGLITFKDLERGSINHALALSIPHTAARSWVFPAQRTDGDSTGRGQIPEGTRFRLNPSIDVARLHLSPIGRMIARAAQRYGIIVRDKGGAVSFYGQASTGGVSPWGAAFAGQLPSQLLFGFPWARLQAMRAHAACCWSASARP